MSDNHSLDNVRSIINQETPQSSSDYPELLDSDEINSIVQTVSFYAAQSFSGPLPTPRLLKEYEETLPGLAERIVLIHEANESHRREMEAKNLDASYKFRTIEKRYGFSLSVIGIFVGLAAIALGVFFGSESVANTAYLAGGGMGTISLIGLVSVLLGSNKKKKKANEEHIDSSN